MAIRMVKSLESLGNTNEDQLFVANGGFEPATFALLARRSNQLSLLAMSILYIS